MKLVIEIDNEHYERIMRLEEGVAVYPTTLALYEAVKNGKPLPEGHGELKDINALRQKLMIWDYKVNAIPNYAWKCIEDAPTIIEADKEG